MSPDTVVEKVLAHELVTNAIGAAVQKMRGRVRDDQLPDETPLNELLIGFVRGAATLAASDTMLTLASVEFGTEGWRKRLSVENSDRLYGLYAADAFIERYMDEMAREEYGLFLPGRVYLDQQVMRPLFEVATQAARMVAAGLDPNLLRVESHPHLQHAS